MTEIERVEKLIADLGPRETWKRRKNLKGNTAMLRLFEARLRDLKAGIITQY